MSQVATVNTEEKRIIEFCKRLGVDLMTLDLKEIFVKLVDSGVITSKQMRELEKEIGSA